jgi:hypothetical protein
MCAGCGCKDVNDVLIPGNKSGIGGNTRGVTPQAPMHRESESKEGAKDERKK